ncbi:MAG: DUF4038 domain-containing protein [Paenibacillaceae bacterium]
MAGNAPANPSATIEARRLLSYLYALTAPNTGILTGQHNWLEVPSDNTNNLAKVDSGGRFPAVADFEMGPVSGQTASTVNTQRANVVTTAKAYWQSGGIPMVCWHCVYPTSAYTYANVQRSTTQAEFNQILTHGDVKNTWLKNEIAAIATHFQTLKAANVPIIFRPWHEMNGYWFWWANRRSTTAGDKTFKDLWAFLYNEMVNVHGLHNILWMWNGSGQANDGNLKPYADFYPGHSMVDILGTDIFLGQYGKAFNHDTLWALGGGRPLVVAEFGTVPDLNDFKANQPHWVISAAWGNPEYTNQNTLQKRQQYYANAYALTRDEVLIPPLDEPTDPTDPSVINPVSPNATLNARRVLSYLSSLQSPTGGCLTGQHNFIEAPTQNNQQLVLPISGGKYPGMSAYEMGPTMAQTPTTAYQQRLGTANAARDYWNAGGIVSFMWNCTYPNTVYNYPNGCQRKTTQTEFNDIIYNTNGANHKWLLAEMDAIAVHFKMLRDAGAPIIFRPWHEMNGYWYWWAGSGKANSAYAKTQQSYTDLWNLTYDRFTNYHGLNNMLWLWNPNCMRPGIDNNIEDFKKFWPAPDTAEGSAKVDMLSWDLYGGEWADFKHDNLWNFSIACFGSKGRPLGISECGPLPLAQTLQDRWYRYSFVSAWGRPEFDQNTQANKVQFYNHPYTLTRDEVVIPANPGGGDTDPTDPTPLSRLQVSGNRRHLQKSTGTPFFWLADTAWELFNRCTRTEVTTYLNSVVSNGFTVVQAVMLAERWALVNANTQGDFPLVGNNPNTPNTTTGANPSNPAEYDYWDHVDYVIDTAARLGLYMAVLPTWGKYILDNTTYGQSFQNIFDNTKAYNYGKWLGTRYANRNNIVWVLGGDRIPDTEAKKTLIRQMVNGLNDGGGTQIKTYHPFGGRSSSEWFQSEAWLSFNAHQSGHTSKDLDNYSSITADYGKTPVKPVLDLEPRYEQLWVNFQTNGAYFNDYDVRQAAYWAVFAGAFGHTYGHNSIQQMYAPGRNPEIGATHYWYSTEALNAPGRSQMRHLRKLMESRPIIPRVPDQSLVTNSLSGGNKVMATRGADYAMIYTRNNITINMGRISGTRVKAYWYNPRTGVNTVIGEFTNTFGTTRAFTVPSSGVNNDWILVLDNISKNYASPGTTSIIGTPQEPAPTPVDTTPPSAPAQLVVTAKTSTTVTLKWTSATDPSGIDVYDIYRAIGMNGTYSYFGWTQDYVNLSYTATGLTPNTLYKFKVKAKDWGSKKFGEFSPEVIVTTNR